MTTELKHIITEKIKLGQVKMTPAWHFTLRSLLYAVGCSIALVIAVYMLSFVMFASRATGLLFAPTMGMHGLIFFIVSSPWLLIGLVGIFLAVLYILVTRFSFSYTRPFVYTLVGIVLFVVGISSLIQYTTFHEQFGSFTKLHGIPGFGPMYENHIRAMPRGVTTGKITSITDSGFIIESETDAGMSLITVSLQADTKIPREGLGVGNMVIVFGPKTSELIEAFGVKLMPPWFSEGRNKFHKKITPRMPQ